MKIGKIPGHWQSLGQGRTKLGGDLGKLSRRKESQLEVVFETKIRNFLFALRKIQFDSKRLQSNSIYSGARPRKNSEVVAR